MGKVKQSGTGNKSPLRRGEMLWRDFLEETKMTDSGARYWMKKFGYKARHVVNPETKKARAVLSKTQVNRICKAIKLTHDKMGYFDGAKKKSGEIVLTT